MASVSISAPGLSSGFLYNNGSNNARVCITSETNEFDMETIRNWQNEGFDVIYEPLNGGGKDYEARLMAVKGGLGVGENYAVIAFGEAASYCLQYYAEAGNTARLCALVAYYPTTVPDNRIKFPFQAKKRRRTRALKPGVGTGERLKWAYPVYTYYEAQPGFAEHDMEEYDHLSASIAWSRTVSVLRKGFSRDVDIEKGLEDHEEAKFFKSNISETMESYVKHKTPTVTYASTLSGGIGAQELQRFYQRFFIGKLPPSMHIRLLSRTTGSDRIVDELYVSFEHSQEIPWMLPGVPPTNKPVEIVLVSIVSIRSAKLYSEHVYWDQASVLVQVGLLDPKLVPNGFSGVDRLPVIGREAARRILHEDPEVEGVNYHNRLIRRANAKNRKNQSSRSSVADESAAELKSDAELPVRSKGDKGKNVQEQQTSPPKLASKNGAGVEHQEEEDDDGDATETEATSTKPEGDKAAYVEEAEEKE
ncbi:hypothetical protein N7468_008875 [Penicillium chermesinum]|uniref:Dienelactone hydrolase n=1 Tax=Penicillium chermesinum TaxID=63820 RepID=A0A9W9NGX5_9EURO|nr:uncharacterized protein N7468_008875 [Penicillium chermesinum]KAJ5219671.1 hypothetical protein N7468_008875 [Penicillium chermesinum]